MDCGVVYGKCLRHSVNVVFFIPMLKEQMSRSPPRLSYRIPGTKGPSLGLCGSVLPDLDMGCPDGGQPVPSYWGGIVRHVAPGVGPLEPTRKTGRDG